MRFSGQDAIALRNQIDIAIRAALITFYEEHRKQNITVKVMSNTVTHTGLEPLGDRFTVSVSVDVYPKDKPKEEKE